MTSPYYCRQSGFLIWLRERLSNPRAKSSLAFSVNSVNSSEPIFISEERHRLRVALSLGLL